MSPHDESPISTEADAAPHPLSIIARRRIEAEMLKLVHDALAAKYGVAEADALLIDVVRASALAQGRHFAAADAAGTSLQSFVKLYELWTMDGALDIDVTRTDATHFDFDVKRCRYSEMYREMGLGRIGHILSCNRDGTFCKGYDPRISLTRTQTIMQGASHCDFRYSYEPGGVDHIEAESPADPPDAGR